MDYQITFTALPVGQVTLKKAKKERKSSKQDDKLCIKYGRWVRGGES
ncbi:hypothetical protein BLGI_2631 [Brevibacillus laterosporus GI-9]|nr:hypothetical protein P615_10805 [Brevibacillus laterosporus PE36]CCF14702.1 hypothetical protein BLGI_2631 [Brevibacillus laterosporus GI-9]